MWCRRRALLPTGPGPPRRSPRRSPPRPSASPFRRQRARPGPGGERGWEGPCPLRRRWSFWAVKFQLGGGKCLPCRLPLVKASRVLDQFLLDPNPKEVKCY